MTEENWRFMNLNRIIFLLIIIFLVTKGLFAQGCKVKVNIYTDLPSSKIYLDTILIGKGNAEIDLDKGVYHLTVMEESDRWNAKSFIDTLKIIECRDTTIKFYFKSEVYLQTDPSDVYVYNYKELIGHTPMFISESTDSMLLKKPGYQERTITAFDLNKDEIIKMNFTGKVKAESFLQRNSFKILVAGIVALGSVSAYYKIKADNNFDKFQSTGEQKFLDLTHKFDLISGITFGALQINFGILIYNFLFD